MKRTIGWAWALVLQAAVVAGYALPVANLGHAAAFPGGCEKAGPQPDTLPGAQSTTYSNTGKRDLRLHVFAPADNAEPRPAILFFFGGGWRTGSINAFLQPAKAFTKLGYVTVLADYRVQCRDGSNPLDSLDDAEAAYAWLRTHTEAYNIDPRRLVLAGDSAGGHLALATGLRAADTEKPAALILFNPVVDLVAPAPKPLKARALSISPSDMPIGRMPPTILFHGELDLTVPIQTVRDFCQRAEASGAVCDLQEYPAVGHGFFKGKPLYTETQLKSVRFLDQLGISPKAYQQRASQ